ncbi:Uncharacterised protein [Klebsiella pneumoniae]|nr:Uncharacterised protein [Klebsiella pneumoniae]
MSKLCLVSHLKYNRLVRKSVKEKVISYLYVKNYKLTV